MMRELPLSTMRKIMAVSKSLPDLKKNDENESGGWKFVSIDDYYDKIARHIAGQGLFWIMREHSIKPDGGDLMITYEADLIDDEAGMFKGFWRLTIPHPFQGAQTAGAALSYADKAFMRSVFKVVTGEPDSDHLAKNGGAKKAQVQQAPAKPKKAPAYDNPLDAFNLVKEEFVNAPSMQSLNKVLTSQAATLNYLRDAAPDLHEEAQGLFEDLMDQFEKGRP